MIHLEKRPQPSKFWAGLTPVLAVIATMIAGGFMFWMLGKAPLEAIRTIFWDPLFHETFGPYSRPQLLVKAAPLILIAVGLSLGFRAGIWNIGAEGQYIMGAICGAGVGLRVAAAWLRLQRLERGFAFLQPMGPDYRRPQVPARRTRRPGS